MPRPQEQFERIADQLPIGRDPASVRRRLEAMEGLLERAFTVPGINRQVGLDAIVGLIPVVGDVVNVASRLEEITREVGGSIAASDACIRATAGTGWPERFGRVQEIRLRGRAQPVVVHIAEPEPPVRELASGAER